MAKTPSMLSACVAKSCELRTLIEYAGDSIVSKTIIDKPVGTITLFAFDKGQKLSEHTAPYDAVIQVIEGSGAVYIDGKENVVGCGQLIIMPANIPHSVEAREKFKMMLIMIRE